MGGTLPRSADVVVVGGGVMGCSIAHRLAESGREVLLLEARTVGSGASGRTGGLLTTALYKAEAQHGLSTARDRLRLTTRNNRLLHRLSEEEGLSFELREMGGLEVSGDEATWAKQATLGRLAAEAGADVELLGPEDCRKLLPQVGCDIVGGRYFPRDGDVNPFLLTQELARLARRAGATLVDSRSVDELVVDRGRVVAVRTRGETVWSGAVVLACNAWTRSLWPEAMIEPLRATVAVTEAMTAFTGWPYFFFKSSTGGLYGRQVASGNIVAGALTHIGEDCGPFDESVDPAHLQATAAAFCRIFPTLGHVRILRAWAGTMGFTPDGLPLIGPLPELAAGVYIAAGFSGYGWCFAAVVGDVIAADLTGVRYDLPLDVVRPQRFLGADQSWRHFGFWREVGGRAT
jgi:glycine/D-amino acid oxidase-like deaminating enzyme